MHLKMMHLKKDTSTNNMTENVNPAGQLFVLAAPSGAGKSSLVKALKHHDPGIVACISHTTRAPRGQEINGKEYHFVSQVAFDDMITNQLFVEWAQVHGKCYGTSKKSVHTTMQTGADVLLEIDFQGALQIKKIFPDAHLIFILPPSWDDLKQRLHGRGEDTPETIAQRLHNAAFEMQQAKVFEFIIVNADFDIALQDLKSIVRSQRLRCAAQMQQQQGVFAALNLC